MTSRPPPSLYSDDENNIQISYLDTQDIFPLIVDARINDENISEIIGDCLNELKYKLTPASPWDEEIILPDSLNEIMDITFNAIRNLYDNDEKYLSVSLADYFFNLCAKLSWKIIAVNGSKNLASEFLEILILKTREWEDSRGILIHKGTPYYFLTSIYLSMNDVDSGFASMFKAIEEDKRTKYDATNNYDEYKKSAAYKYASLLDDKFNYLYHSVMRIRSYIDGVINIFNQNTTYNLSLNDVDQKFLNNDDMEELKFVFVYVLEKFLKYHDQFSEFKLSNEFYELRNSSNIFELCIIVDKILEKKYESKYRITFPNRRLYLSGLVWCLFDDKGWITGINHAGELKDNLSPNILDMSPERTFHHITSGSATLSGVPISNEMGAILLTWRLRNWSAHTLKREKIFVSKYQELFERLMWAFLIAIEAI